MRFPIREVGTGLGLGDRGAEFCARQSKSDGQRAGGGNTFWFEFPALNM